MGHVNSFKARRQLLQALGREIAQHKYAGNLNAMQLCYDKASAFLTTSSTTPAQYEAGLDELASYAQAELDRLEGVE